MKQQILSIPVLFALAFFGLSCSKTEEEGPVQVTSVTLDKVELTQCSVTGRWKYYDENISHFRQTRREILEYLSNN